MRNNFCASTFAVGIAIGKVGPGDKPGSTGFTPAELVTQKVQLLEIAGSDQNIYILIRTEPVQNPWQQLFLLVGAIARMLFSPIFCLFWCCLSVLTNDR